MIKFNINDIIKKDITIKILSVVLALVIWSFVLNLRNPLETKSFAVAIKEVNINSLDQNKLILKSQDYRKYISVKITGRKDKINNINQNDFQVIADFSKIKRAGEQKLKLERRPIVNDNSVRVQYDQKYLELKLESVDASPYTVNVTTEGKVKKGYSILKKTTVPKTIDINNLGPNGQNIKDVKTSVDINGLDKDTTFDAVCKFYDRNGNLITNLYETKTVKVRIEIAKDVEVNAFTVGTPEESYQVGIKKVFPETVLLKGNNKVLQNIDSINTENIDINGLNESKNFTSNIVLPDGVFLAAGNEKVNVNIEITNLSKKTIPIFKEDIKLKGKNDKQKYEITTPSILVELIGDKEDLNSINVQSLEPTIDLKEYDNEDQEVVVELKLPNNIKTVKPYKVEVKVF